MENKKFIALIRISGKVDMDKDAEETFTRLRLGKKYTCVVIQPTKEIEGAINKMRSFIAYGEISNETFKNLIEKRAKVIDKTKKINPEKVVEELLKGKKYSELNIKPYFGLHPPRKGIKSKLHFPRGVLGNHGPKINDLIERML